MFVVSSLVGGIIAFDVACDRRHERSADRQRAEAGRRGMIDNRAMTRREFTGSAAALPLPAQSRGAFRVIDPHVHVWKHDARYPWAKETTRPPSEDATAETLLKLMDANGVAGTVIVQYIGYRWDNSYARDAIRRYPKRFLGVCRINPESPSAPDDLERLVKEEAWRGVRLSPAANASGDWIGGALMPPLWRRAQQLKIPMLMLTSTPRLPQVGKLIGQFPDLDVCIDHMADCPLGQPEELAKLLDLARHPRVFVKISHTWTISKQEYPYRDTHDQVKKVYDAFGPQRLMWGTDWPLVERVCGYTRALALVRDEMTFLNDNDKSWILGRTVERLWPFPV
jgi:predicted TIM-barrel fold metal-dependent hydrolase